MGHIGSHDLAVRPMRPDEAVHVVDYFLGLGDDDLRRMAIVPRSSFPAREAWVAKMEAAIAAGPASGSFYYAWLLDGKPVGDVALKGLKAGEGADLHLHMWTPAVRGKGFGATFVAMCIVDAYGRFRLRGMVCEPAAGNPMPNRMLRKAGFPLLGTREGSSSELSATTTLNRYGLPLDVARRLSPRGASGSTGGRAAKSP